MINTVSITAKFVTGTTMQNSEQAEAAVKKLFIDALAKAFIYSIDDRGESGLFSVEIQEVKAEQI